MRETTRAGWPLSVLAASGVVLASAFLVFVGPSFGRIGRRCANLGMQLPAVTQLLISTPRSVWIAGGLAVGAFLILKNRLLLRSAALVIDVVALVVALAALALGAGVVIFGELLVLMGGLIVNVR